MDTTLALIFANQWLVLILVLALLLGFTELGYYTGNKRHSQKDEPRKNIVGGIQAAILGLLGLLIGFTFSMALSRYESRREIVLGEANAIGTTYLRASLLPEPHQTKVKELFGEYLDARLSFYDAGADRDEIINAEAQTQKIQQLLWNEAIGASQAAPNAVTVSFINSLNQTIDYDATRLFALTSKVPGAVWLLVLIVACAGCYVSGYSTGAHGVRSAMSGILLPVLMTIVITLIADLDRPRRGMVGVDQQPLLNLKALIRAE